jgi:hypothetical protein
VGPQKSNFLSIEKLGKTFAKYHPSSHQLGIDPNEKGGLGMVPTISHELAHVYDDIGLHISDDLETDEAMGYSMQDIAQVVEGLYQLETIVRTHDCLGVRSEGSASWNNFWRRWNTIPSETWGKAYWPTPWNGGATTSSRYLTTADLTKLRQLHGGVQLSCKAVADALNEILWSKGCCASFTCSKDSGPGEIGTGVTINSFFQ